MILKQSHLIWLCFPPRVLEIEDLRNIIVRVKQCGVAALPALPAKPEGLRRTAEVFEPRPLGYASGARPSLRSVLRGDRRGEGVSLSHTVPQPVYEPIRPTHNGRPWRPVLCYCCNAPAVYRETFASRDREGRTRMRGVCSACSRAARDGRHDRSPYRTRLRQASAPGRTGRNGTPFTQNLTPAPFNLNRVD